MFVNRRLAALAAWLGEREYLEGRYTAADLLMTTVLRNLRHTEPGSTRQLIERDRREWRRLSPPPGPEDQCGDSGWSAAR